jgi:hypothetical protein
MNKLRRRIILGFAAAGAALSIPGLTGALEKQASSLQVLSQRLANLVARRRSGAEVGRAYLAAGGLRSESSATALADSIARDLGIRPSEFRSIPDRTLRSMLNARVRKDFEQEKVIIVSGWMLSRTEARIYALTTLT